MLRQGIARGAWFITLAPVLISGATIAAGFSGGPAQGAGAEAAHRPPTHIRTAPRIECPAPRTLRLRRFEDGSAQLLCQGRVLVRISVPG